MRPSSLKDVAALASSKPHGTRIRYMAGCRCLPCRAANSRYEVERQAARRRGEWNGIVPAVQARRHILMLGRHGLGYKHLAKLAHVSKNTVYEVRNGEKQSIRALTEKRILAIQVNGNTLAGHSFVKANRTHTMIGKLLKRASRARPSRSAP